MSTKRVYYRTSTIQQRKLLFETWEATGSVKQACEQAHLSRGTFYWWKPRFEEAGYAGLEQTRSHARQQQKRIPQPIRQEVIAMRKAHAEWGKQRIAQEVAKAHHWVPVVSHNTVQAILQAAGLWPAPREEKKMSAGQRKRATPNSRDRR